MQEKTVNVATVRGNSQRFSKVSSLVSSNGGADGIRTHDLLDAIEARSQLRHGPTVAKTTNFPVSQGRAASVPRPHRGERLKRFYLRRMAASISQLRLISLDGLARLPLNSHATFGKDRKKCRALGQLARRRRAQMREKSVVCAGERATAENDCADGANGLLIGDADIAALKFFFDGHFGNDGNAHARANHAEKTAELAAFKNDLGMEPRAVAGSNGGISEAVAVAQQQEGFGANLFEGKRRAGGEFVFLWEHREEPLG